MKVYTIVGGVNGVGKSSFIGILRELISDLGCVVDEYETEAGKIALHRIDTCISDGVNFTQETTLSGSRTLKTIHKAKSNDYKIRMYYVGIDNLVENIIRIENRVRKGGHSISVEDVTRRYNSRYVDFIKVLPYCDIGEIYDNGNGFEKLADIQKGKIIAIKKDNLPLWFKELQKLVDKQ